MSCKSLKSKLSMLLIGISLVPNFILTAPAKAQEYCKIEPVKRTLFSHPVANLDRQIELAMRSAELEGEVQKILWADGLQSYEFINGKPEIFAPSADLFSVESLGQDIYIFNSKKIGSHYKIDTPVWEFAGSRLVAEEVTKIDGAGEKDAPWLLVKTNQKDYYILRIETRGGVPPKENCSGFEGVLDVPYQTIYVIIKTDSPPQALH